MWTAGVVAVALVASAACALADSQCYSATGNDVRVEFVDRCNSPLNDGRNRSIRISASRGEQSLASTRLSCPRRRFKSPRRRSVPRPWWTASSKVRGAGVHDHDVCSCRCICFVEIGLSDFKGKYLVLFFYPMDLYVGRGTSECSVVAREIDCRHACVNLRRNSPASVQHVCVSDGDHCFQRSSG